MSQMTFSDYEYSLRKRKTKREEFLEIMEEIIPWDEWVEFVRPYYPDGRRGRPTKGIEKMLRMYLLQVWFNLSDEAVEDAIYDSYYNFKLNSAICLRRIIWEKPFSLRSSALWMHPAISCTAARLLMQQSLRHRARPKMQRNSVIRRCIRLKKEISGISE